MEDLLSSQIKEDLISLAIECGLDPGPDPRLLKLKRLIITCKGLEEKEVGDMLKAIVEMRQRQEKKEKEERERQEKKEERERQEKKEKEERERQEKKEKEERERQEKKEERERQEKKEERERQEKKEEREHELELEKVRLEASSRHSDSLVVNSIPTKDLSRVMPKFNPKEDMGLYLTLFERQATLMSVERETWVSHLVSLFPQDISQIIAREPADLASNYDYMKSILLQRFKLTPEKFRQLFNSHQKGHDRNWRDFAYELTTYFDEWIAGFKIDTFDKLRELIISDQMKKKATPEFKEMYIKEWVDITSPAELVKLLEKFEDRQQTLEKSHPSTNDRFQKQDPSWRRRNEVQRSSPRGIWNRGNTEVRRHEPEHDHGRETRCFHCKQLGHFRPDCPELRRTTRQSEAMTARVSVGWRVQIDNLTMVNLKCGDVKIEGIMDTGAQISVVRYDLVSHLPSQGEGKITITSAFGDSEEALLRTLHLKIDDNHHNTVPVICALSKKLKSDMLVSSSAYEALKEEIQVGSFLIQSEEVEESEIDKVWMEGMDQGNEITCFEIQKEDEMEEVQASNSELQVEEVEEIVEVSDGNKRKFSELQSEDETLRAAWRDAEARKNSYEIQEGILFHYEIMAGERVGQVVLPFEKREKVLKIAHELPVGGHFGEVKTTQRIKYSFYWPNIKKDVQKFCRSCKTCQLKSGITYRDRIPIQPLVRPETPFEVWSVDCIGPLDPPSRRGHRFAICAVDLCSRWADVIPTKDITAKTTCNALMKIFTQTGFPKTICTDQGTNFTSKLTSEFHKLIGVAPRFSTPGHPESMGAVERWNRTLKSMIGKNIQEHGYDWDLHLPFLLFAYREVPHSTTGMSPFQLVYGRIPPGPLSLLRQFWIGEKTIPVAASRSVESYLQDLLIKLQKAHEIASENSGRSQEAYASHYNLRSKNKIFDVGDKVLVLIPSSSYKLQSSWQGPATVIERTRRNSVKVEFEDGSLRELHVNKIRPFITRVQHIGLIFEEDHEFGELHYAPVDQIEDLNYDISNLSGLKEELGDKFNQLVRVIDKHRVVFSSSPGQAKVMGHRIKLKADNSPKRLKPYRIPIALQDEVDRQVKELLELRLIEHSDSEWAHPVVCVAKAGGGIRLCVDFRLLNSFTISEAYPMRIARDLIYEIGKAKFITTLDLTKGYWQIPMEESSRPYTGFVTHRGHFQWRVMPFGLKNAGSTFQRAIDTALDPHRKFCRAYIDDIAVFSETWEDHLNHITQVFETLKELGFTVNLGKCSFAQSSVKFLGHIIGSGRHSPDPQKVEVIRAMSRPTTKKEVRSILGLTSYYREYFPNFAELTLPLTELTKKHLPNKVQWSERAERSYQKIKRCLVDIPSLYTPDLDKPFQLYTDASATAIGACLSQRNETGKENPIAFFSRKLTDTQRRWSTIEREAFSVIEALKKFDTWIFGAEIEVISDHNPLTFLTHSQPQGAKLARWALALQRYNVSVVYRKGTSHGNADALSRLPCPGQ